jgi:hypothetical protein
LCFLTQFFGAALKGYDGFAVALVFAQADGQNNASQIPKWLVCTWLMPFAAYAHGWSWWVWTWKHSRRASTRSQTGMALDEALELIARGDLIAAA